MGDRLTSPAIVDRLTSDIAAAIADAQVGDILAAHGMQRLRMIREQFRRFVDDEARRAAQIIRAPQSW